MSKTAVITGGTRGIGRACALKFAREGYSLALIYKSRRKEALQLAEILAENGAEAELYCCDVSSYKDAEKTAQAILQRFGRVDVLVNNAGISSIDLLIDQNEEDWDRIMGVNAKGVFNFTRHILPHMLSEKKGSIVNISSMWGITGASCEVIYSASKAAVTGFTKALAKETAPSGVRVNCVAPGVIDTEMNSCLEPEAVKALEEEIPLMRIGKAEEVAEAVFFLASEKASYITGQILSADGGMVI